MAVPGHSADLPPASAGGGGGGGPPPPPPAGRGGDAVALRAVARSLNLSVSGYVASLAAAGDAPTVRRDQERLADVSRLAAATAQVPDEVRRLRGDLLRLGGLVKSLFIREESVLQAERFSFECAEALRELTQAADRTEPVLGRIEDRLQFIRYQLEQTRPRGGAAAAAPLATYGAISNATIAIVNATILWPRGPQTSRATKRPTWKWSASPRAVGPRIRCTTLSFHGDRGKTLPPRSPGARSTRRCGVWERRTTNGLPHCIATKMTDATICISRSIRRTRLRYERSIEATISRS